jgi:hypothetical protein
MPFFSRGEALPHVDRDSRRLARVRSRIYRVRVRLGAGAQAHVSSVDDRPGAGLRVLGSVLVTANCSDLLLELESWWTFSQVKTV